MSRFWLVPCITALASVFLAAGCASPAPAAGIGSVQSTSAEPQVQAPITAAKTSQPGPTTAGTKYFASAQQVGDLKVDLVISPFPPAGRNPTSLEVRLTDASGQIISDAQVSLDLTMPAMPMPTAGRPASGAARA